MVKLKAYKKTIAAVTGAIISWAQLVVGSSQTNITAPEWIVLGIGLATAFGVYSVSNKSS